MIESVLPEGIRIGPAPYGRGLYATKAFAKGSVVYRASYQLIEFQPGAWDKYALRVVTPGGRPVGSYVVDSRLHSVVDSGDPAYRQVYGFDGFMNHSCAPNIWPVEVGGATYEAHALRDIAVGDEITCDYAVFDYDCDGHEIEVCRCGAASCLGSMTGFVNLSLPEQVRRLHMCDETLLARFLAEAVPPVVILESALPDGIGVAGDDGVRLVALRNFKAGEIVFTNTVRTVPKDVEATYLLRIAGLERYFLASPGEHLVERAEHWVWGGFDCLMSHSSDPNLEQRYTSTLDYQVTAVRDIAPGEMITYDFARASGAISERALDRTTRPVVRSTPPD